MFYKIALAFLVINILAALANIRDKHNAKHNQRRVPEATLWWYGLLGGATGSYLTMKLIRHKTKHKSFMLGMPLLMVIQLAVMTYLFFYLQ